MKSWWRLTSAAFINCTSEQVLRITFQLDIRILFAIRAIVYS